MISSTISDKFDLLRESFSEMNDSDHQAGPIVLHLHCYVSSDLGSQKLYLALRVLKEKGYFGHCLILVVFRASQTLEMIFGKDF